MDPTVAFALVAPTQVTLRPGDSTLSILNVVRNKGFRKAPAQIVLRSDLPEGISIELTPHKDVMERASLRWKAAPLVRSGEYVVVLACKLQNLTKGVTVKLVIDSPEVVQADPK